MDYVSQAVEQSPTTAWLPRYGVCYNVSSLELSLGEPVAGFVSLSAK